MAGRFDRDALRRRVEELFGDWAGEAPSPPEPPHHGLPGYRHVVKETAQVHIGAVTRALPADHPDYYDYLMAVRVLSGGMAARLFTEVREKRGLVYAVSAGLRVMRGLGVIQAYAGTTTERAWETLKVLLEEITRLADGVSAEEMERARAGILSALVMQGESSSARAAALVSDYRLLGRIGRSTKSAPPSCP